MAVNPLPISSWVGGYGEEQGSCCTLSCASQKKWWATWERSSACGLSDDLVCCRKHGFFSTAVFLCRLWSHLSPWHAYVSEPQVLFAFSPYSPFTFILSLGPYDATRCLNVKRNYVLIYLRDDYSDGTSESRWCCFISINTFKYFFAVFCVIISIPSRNFFVSWFARKREKGKINPLLTPSRGLWQKPKVNRQIKRGVLSWTKSFVVCVRDRDECTWEAWLGFWSVCFSNPNRITVTICMQSDVRISIWCFQNPASLRFLQIPYFF